MPRRAQARSLSSATTVRSSSARRRKGQPAPSPWPTWRLVVGLLGLLLIAVGVIAELAVWFPSGTVGEPTRRGIAVAVGWTAPLLPVWPIALGAFALLKAIRPEYVVPRGRIWGALLAYLALIGLSHLLLIGGQGSLARAQEGQGGGLLGFGLAIGLSDTLGATAGGLLLVAGLLLGGLLVCDLTLRQVVRWSARQSAAGGLAGLAWLRTRRERRQVEVRINTPRRQFNPSIAKRMAGLVQREPATPPRTNEMAARAPAALPPLGAESWKLPPHSLFEAGSPAELSQVDVRQRAKTIEETLASFNIEARVVEVNQGPTVTQFGIEPAAGVAVRRILTLQNDLGLRLGAWPVRFEAPVPGKRVVGLEVPNQSVAVVAIRGLLESEQAARVRSQLRLALGQDVSGRPVVVDLARMPHLLIAGATGSGKSVCINSILASLLSQNSPDALQFMMIDPKMVELMPYNGIPHLRMPVVTDMDRVVGALKWVVREMERRYGLFVQRSARNIESYNRSLEIDQGERCLPYLVVVIDELADMMMMTPDEVEVALCRLAQKARATGIHLIVATQRPSVDVLTGMIKANFVTRIAFAVSSQVDSRVILDTVGAEKLLGRGDMLFSSGDTSKPIRIQGAWVSDQELQRLIIHWKRQGLPRFTDADVDEMASLGVESGPGEGDELFDRAIDVATQYSRVSTSLLQRRLGIGYPRAARLIDQMEERGVIGAAEDGKSRTVLVRAEAASEE